jgi:ABC-type uncharacterized transport system involved in gliding motility auxiliary subunit
MTRLLSTILGVIGALALVIGINVFADARLANLHVDLTAQHLYTLSSGTRAVLRGLKDPITLRVFYSRALGTAAPAYGTLADHVQELLRQYVALSGGKLKVETYDPQPFSDVEDRALAYGLQGVPLDQSGENVYFGIVGTNLLDDEKTIAFVQPERERFLEYDLTKLVLGLSNPKQPVVGLMSSLPVEGDPRQMMMAARSGSRAGAPWLSIDQLRQTDAVRTIAPDVTVIPADIDVLLLVQAQNLSDSTLYAIDQFVMRGGRLMAMVDPHSEAQAMASRGGPPADASSDLPKLFDAWGITFDVHHVVGDLDGAWRVRARDGDRVAAVDYVPWFNIRDGIAKDDPATADLQQVTVASAGAVGVKPGAALTFTPLLTSGPQSELLPVDEIIAPDPAAVLASFHPTGGPRVLAARFRGVLRSAFAAPPPAPDGKPRPADFPAHLSETKGPANLVVVGDTDILADRYWVRVQDFFGQPQATPFSDNAAFLANVIGTLAGGDALIGLRSRGDSIRPFDVVTEIQARAEAEFRQSEHSLQAHLDEVQKKLRELRAGDNAGSVVTPAQTAAIEAARDDILNTRRQLRRVQLNLRQDIAALGTKVKLADIVAVPALLTVVALALAYARRRRRMRARA